MDTGFRRKKKIFSSSCNIVEKPASYIAVTTVLYLMHAGIRREEKK